MARTIVGLDIGSSGVRAAEFKLGKRPALRRFATAALPAGSLQSGVVTDADAVTQTLRKLWAEAKFSTKTVVFGIANEGVLVRQMELDWMPPADFRKALRYQVADILPVPVDEANLDYHVLGEHEVPGGHQGERRRVLRILLVAAARDTVDGYVAAVQGAGLRPVRADLKPFALVRACNPALAGDAPPDAVVDIGAESVTVTVHHNGQPRFVRMIAGLGSNNITLALQERYGWTWEEAERTKVVLGLPETAADASPAGQPAHDHPAQELIGRQAAHLVGEIRTTLDFFAGSDPEAAEIGRVLLAGSGARLQGLAAQLSTQLGVPVEPLSPLAGIRKRRRLRLDEQRLAQLAVPAGLCMGVTR